MTTERGRISTTQGAVDRAVGNDVPMNDDPSAQALEHLQRAAREMIAAARLFLDAAEELVDDPAIVKDVAGMAGGVVGEVVTELRRAGRARSGTGRPFEADLDERDAEQDAARDAARANGNSTSRAKRSGGRGPSRVRRIDVE